MAKIKEDGGIPISFATTEELIAELRQRWKGVFVLGMAKGTMSKKPIGKEPQMWLCHSGSPIMLLGILELLTDNVKQTRFRRLFTNVERKKKDE